MRGEPTEEGSFDWAFIANVLSSGNVGRVAFFFCFLFRLVFIGAFCCFIRLLLLFISFGIGVCTVPLDPKGTLAIFFIFLFLFFFFAKMSAYLLVMINFLWVAALFGVRFVDCVM